MDINYTCQLGCDTEGDLSMHSCREIKHEKKGNIFEHTIDLENVKMEETEVAEKK